MMNTGKIKPLGRGILFGVGALVFAAFLALLFGWVLMLLWNWLMPEIFGLPLIGYWQAWGLILLSHLLFKNGGHGGSRRAQHFHPGRGRRPGGGPGGRNGRHGRHDNEDFDDFKREFRDRMKARWHDSEESRHFHDSVKHDSLKEEDIIPGDDKD